MNSNSPTYKQNLISITILLLGLLLVLILGLISNNRNTERILLETRITAEQVRIRLESCVDSSIKPILALANFRGGSPEQAIDSWADSAGTLFPIFSGVLALNYVDPDGVIRVVYPPETNQRALNANLRDHANASVRQALTTAEASSGLIRTDILDLLQSGKGFAFYKRILSPEGQLLGFANGVIRVQELMDACLSEKPLRNQFVFGILENDELIFSQPPSNLSLQSPYRVTLPIQVIGRPWQLSFAPLQSYLDETNSSLDEIGIGLGILMAVLLALASRTLLKQQNFLTEKEDKYRLLVENQTDMVVKVDPQGSFLYVSPSYCNTFGIPESQLLNRQFLPLVHEDDRAHTKKSLASLKHPPHTSYHEQRAMTKEGWRWLAWSNTAIMDGNGRIEAITGVGRDVTEIKRLEENIARSQKMKALGEMAGGITHDFNNMLQVIIGSIEGLLMVDTHSKATRRTLEQIGNVVLRGMNLTEKLSTLSRQEQTRKETFNINLLVEELTTLLERTLPASVSLSSAPSDQPLHIFADRAQIEQVLLNICFNARDAIESNGNIKVSTTTQTVDGNFLKLIPNVDPGEYSVITVEDDGCGIEPEVLPRIFDPFYTTKDTGLGTGLGLANCYSIVEQHKGMILVDSEPSSGSRFSVYLPLSLVTDDSPQETPSSIHRLEKTDNTLVLVADDNAEILELTRLSLNSMGFQTLAAANGVQALELFHQHRHEISLVILDVVMPEMGGEAVAEQIRLVDSDMKILFVTGYIPDEMTAGLTEPIIRKPYQRGDFLKAIENLLGS
ncbi:ATP-binding protein [Granulosicoccus sp. 3-233]|uniref:hybrid sensor histidine kinase/response regulator n=1 Tax=Granulosicoccus sp. 3-233 TaxID=3417969 RepID=UPI003D32825D